MRHNPLYIDLYEKSTGNQVHPKQVDSALRDALGHLGYPYDNDSWYLDWMTELSIKGADAASHLRKQSTGTLLVDVKGNGYYKNLDPTQTMTSEEKEAYDAYSQFYNDKADALDWITDHYSFNSGHAPRNNPRKKPAPSRGRKPARDNATFTGEPIKGLQPRHVVDTFYAEINRRIPGSTSVPIPPIHSLHINHDVLSQAFIFADYAVRKFAPIVLSVVGSQEHASRLRKLPKIVDVDTANAAIKATSNAASAARREAGTAARAILKAGYDNSAAAHAFLVAIAVVKAAQEAAYYARRTENATVEPHSASATELSAADSADRTAEYAAEAAAEAAVNYTPTVAEQIWKAANEMLAELSGIRSNKSHKPARDNANFTGEPLIYDTPDQMTVLVSEFYRAIDERIPGNTPVPIPPPESIHPRRLLPAQCYIFADYAVRRFAPIQLEATEFSHEAEVLRNLPKITNRDTLNRAMDKATNAQKDVYEHTKPFYTDSYTVIDDARAALTTVFDYNVPSTDTRTALYAAMAACRAAKVNPGETWKAVKEMLKSL